MKKKEPMAYDLHYDEIRQVLATHFNEFPNALISDIAELVRNKNDKALEGMVAMTMPEFDEVSKKIANDKLREVLEKVDSMKYPSTMSSITSDALEVYEEWVNKEELINLLQAEITDEV